MTSFMKNRKAQLIFLQFFLIALLLSAEVTVTYMAKKNAAGIEAKSEVKKIILGSIQEFEAKTVFYDSLLRESIRRYAIDEIQADCDTEYTISEFYTDISSHQTTLEDVVNDYITNYNTRYGIVSYSVPWVSEFVFTEESDYLEIVAIFDEELNPPSLKIEAKGVRMDAGESMTIEIHNPMDFCVD